MKRPAAADIFVLAVCEELHATELNAPSVWVEGIRIFASWQCNECKRGYTAAIANYPGKKVDKIPTVVIE